MLGAILLTAGFTVMPANVDGPAEWRVVHLADDRVLVCRVRPSSAQSLCLTVDTRKTVVCRVTGNYVECDGDVKGRKYE